MAQVVPDKAGKLAIDPSRPPASVSIAVASYDRTRPVLDGRVKPDGIDLSSTAKYVGEFCVKPVYEEYDAAEMSFSWYVTARSQDEPVMALPVFPLRMPILTYVFVGEGSSLSHPSELIGKRIGVPAYRFTVNLWLRGIFKEHYGVAPEQVQWVTCEKEEGAGYTVPDGIEIRVCDGAAPRDLLARGEADALFLPRLPDGYMDGTSGMRHLFPDAQAEMQSYVKKTGIVPITHTLAIKKSLSIEQPWISESLTKCFMAAQDMANATAVIDPKYLSFFDAAFYQAQNRRIYGADSWSHGVARNRKTLETFLRYAFEQGYLRRRLTVDELFPANTLDL